MKVHAYVVILAVLDFKTAQCGKMRSHMQEAAESHSSSRAELSLIKSERSVTMDDQEASPTLEVKSQRKHEEPHAQNEKTREDAPRKGVLSWLQAPPNSGKGGGVLTGGSWTTRILIQFLFGAIYYFLIVAKYPKINGLQPTAEAIKLQSENEVSASLKASYPNCFFSYCCSGPRAAHTFHSTDTMDFWPGCIAMSLFPCCTLWLVNSFTDLNAKLGGVKKDFFMGLICACCCSCCVIAQDAESLDMITGARTNLCGVDTENINNPREGSQRLV